MDWNYGKLSCFWLGGNPYGVRGGLPEQYSKRIEVAVLTCRRKNN